MLIVIAILVFLILFAVAPEIIGVILAAVIQLAIWGALGAGVVVLLMVLA